MKFITSIILALCLLGCASPEKTAYRATGTITALVDGAMNGWGDYVRAGLASDSEQASVRKAYIEYQEAVFAARTVVRTAKAAPDGQPVTVTTILAVEAASGHLVSLVGSLIHK